jgi:hypothetical protein
MHVELEVTAPARICKLGPFIVQSSIQYRNNLAEPALPIFHTNPMRLAYEHAPR